MKENYQKKFFKENVNQSLNVKNEAEREQSYSYYSRVLNKPFDTVNDLKKAEATYYAEIKAKEDKAAQKKADAKKVEEAFKAMNAARKTYKESITTLTDRYAHALKDLKTAFENDKLAANEALAEAEEGYSAALKAFTDKYPEGYHLTLKDGDFETTISSQTTSDSRTPTRVYNITDIFDFLFNS